MLKPKGEENIKGARKEQLDEETSIRLRADFSLETVEGRRQWDAQRKKSSAKNPIFSKSIFLSLDEIKDFLR